MPVESWQTLPMRLAALLAQAPGFPPTYDPKTGMPADMDHEQRFDSTDDVSVLVFWIFAVLVTAIGLFISVVYVNAALNRGRRKRKMQPSFHRDSVPRESDDLD